MPAVTPTLTFCDELVSLINTNWGPTGGQAVQRVYQFRQPQDQLTAQQVWILPTDYRYVAENRKEDNITHLVTAVCASRYTDSTHAGLPPNSWLDPLVDFVYTQLVRDLWFKREGPLEFGTSPVRSVITLSVDVQVADIEKLTTTPGMFWAVVDYEFLELVAGA